MNSFRVLELSIEEVQHRLDAHRRLLNGLDDEMLKTEVCFPLCARRQRLRNALKEAIDVLEDSRRSFKSKQLESLRKRLIQTLAEDI